jgi:hypothetical protein
MRRLKSTIALVLGWAVITYAQGNTFSRVRYNGGSVPSKVDPKDWGNKLTIPPEAIRLDFKDKQSVEIPARKVTSLSYGQEAHRRVGTMIALAVLVAPVAFFTKPVFITSAYGTPRPRAKVPASSSRVTKITIEQS